jgi:hypothetical protein
LKGALASALKTELTVDDRSRLTSFMDSLPVESPETEQIHDIPPDNSSVDASQPEAGNVI